MKREIASLKKSLNNCKKGNWDNLDVREINRMISYQENQLIMNEEHLTFEEYDLFKELLIELVVICEKRTGYKYSFEYI